MKKWNSKFQITYQKNEDDKIKNHHINRTKLKKKSSKIKLSFFYWKRYKWFTFYHLFGDSGNDEKNEIDSLFMLS